MKTILYFLLLSVSGALSFSIAYAQNTVYGTRAGTGGTLNTHIGYYAGKNSTGTSNSFVGHLSGYRNTTGYYNTFVGYSSGYNTTSGFQNTFIGTSSGYRNSIGNYNTFLGNFSGHNNTSGSFNAFVGSLSGWSNTTGNFNTFFGNQSGYANTYGSDNTFVGNSSGYSNTSGSSNTFLGRSTGTRNTTGSSNTFVGYASGSSNTTGGSNTYLGNYSGYSNISGEKNIFIGYQAGYSETGSNRLYIDNNNDSNPLLYGNFSSNVLSIGTKYTGTTYKLVVPGKVRATEYWVRSSSGSETKISRLSSSSRALPDALAKLQKVETISYRLTDEVTAKQVNAKAKSEAEQQTSLAFLAENLQQVFPALVIEEEGETAINYQGMIPVLVEAVKELSLQKDNATQVQAQLDQLKLENAALKEELAMIKEALGVSKHSSLNGADLPDGSLLEQNHPNPFTQSTTISYQAPAQAQQVSLLITNLQGVEVQRFNDLAPGAGAVEVAAGSLSVGTYVYTLVVDGKPLASQKMILTR